MSQDGARKITIFYSWQSDREDACCKHFIRIAAETAAAAVGTRLGLEVVIDADTEGVAGTPPITDTILRKIEACDLFLADMTFVAETGGSKLVPNPNVMGEYGYALRAKSVNRVLLAMNTAFGPPDALPFDLRHMRHPAQYALAEGAPAGERRATRQRFASTLERNIETAVRAILEEPAMAPSDRWAEAEAALQSLYLQPFAMPVPVIVSGPKLLVNVVPLAALEQADIAPAAVKSARPRFPPSVDARVEEGSDETHWWASGVWGRVADKPNPETTWLFRLTNGGLIQIQTTIGHRIDDDPDIPIPGQEIEAHLVSAADRAAKVAEAVGLQGPALVSASLEQIEDVEIHRARGRKLRLKKPSAGMGVIRLETLKVPMADRLKPLMDRMWLIGGWDDGSPFFDNGHWTGHANTLGERPEPDHAQRAASSSSSR